MLKAEKRGKFSIFHRAGWAAAARRMGTTKPFCFNFNSKLFNIDKA